MLESSLIIVGANKGGVGKTTVTRALIEYFEIKNYPFKVYDTQSPGGNLRRYHPDFTEIIDIENTRDQCRLLDDLDTPGRVTIVDLRAGALFSTLRLLRECGVFEASAEGRLKLSVLHLIGTSHASIAEIEDAAPFLDECNYRVVSNFAGDRGRLRRGAIRSKSNSEGSAREILIPRLDSLAFETVELSGASFTSFVLDEAPFDKSRPSSFVLRGYVKTWLERVWDNFEAAGVDNLVAFRDRTSATTAKQVERSNKRQRSAAR
jgi:hypothetical protein